MKIIEGLSLFLLAATVLSINIWPIVIYLHLRALRTRVDQLYVVVNEDPDPGADEDEPPAQANVVAFGKRRA